MNFRRLFCACALTALVAAINNCDGGSGSGFEVPDAALSLVASALDAAFEHCQQTYAGTTMPPSTCTGSKLGDGLHCPERSEPRELAPFSCDYKTQLNMKGAAFGYGEFTGTVTYLVSTTSTTNQSMTHEHKCEAETAGACAEQWVDWAMVVEQSTQIEVAVNLNGTVFRSTQDAGAAGKRKGISLCQWTAHPEPRDCQPAGTQGGPGQHRTEDGNGGAAEGASAACSEAGGRA